MARRKPAATSGSVGCVFRKKMAAKEIATTAVNMPATARALDGPGVLSLANRGLLYLGVESGAEATSN